MEELQDAIEDARYVNAMHDETPKPTKDWNWLSIDEMSSFMTKISFKEPQMLELDTICHDSLGFYLYIDFVKQNGDPVLGTVPQSIYTIIYLYI